MFMLKLGDDKYIYIVRLLAHYTSGNAKRAKRKFIRNASTLEEFGKIWQCFY